MTAPRRALRVIAVALTLLLMLPAISTATTVIDETFSDRIDTSSKESISAGGGYAHYPTFDSITLNHIENHATLNYVAFVMPYKSDVKPLAEGRYDITYQIESGKSGTGAFYVAYNRAPAGNVISYRFTVFFYDWDIGTLTGRKYIKLDKKIGTFGADGVSTLPSSYVGGIGATVDGHNYIHARVNYEFAVVSSIDFKNRLIVTEDNSIYTIDLKRNVDGKAYASAIDLMKSGASVHRDYSGSDITLFALTDEIDAIKLVTTSNKEFVRSLSSPGDPGDPGDPGTADVTVYIKNSQTGALIADANVVVEALVNGTYYPVVNRTEPSGIFSINLQPTGGGQPNPDGYRLIVTADGYNNPMPEINFTVDDYKKYIYCLLDPIAGGPVNENKTFIDFFVRDMSSNPISGATVKFGKYTLITNSAGYTVFEVDKSNTYSWTISKSGYSPLTGNAVIGDAPRHTINTVLSPVATPTTQTPIPTGTAIGPTPTMTAPTGEPVSNWLEWFAAHFGMILGGGVEIGKIFMWLCFSVPAGVYVAKEAKSGAAGFMAGAGIVTLFFVLIGWVPIWLLVLLALIIGLLYAKVLNNSDTGGGR